MAGDWIKWQKGLAARREVVVLASRLQRDRHEIAGRLMQLWEWCDDNMTDDDVDPMSLDVSLKLGDKPFAFVDALLGLPGMADVMASVDVRWLTARSDGRLTFPNLARHNGTSAKTRASEARKKQNQRQAKSSGPGKCPGNNGTTSGPEKRREEKNSLSTESDKARTRASPSEIAPETLPERAERPPDGPSEFAEDCERLIRAWNACPQGVRGVVRHRGICLSPKLMASWRDVWGDGVRREAAFAAIAAIKAGVAFEWERPALSLSKFLESDEIDKITGGGHAKYTRSTERPANRVDGAADIAARPAAISAEEFLRQHGATVP